MTWLKSTLSDHAGDWSSKRHSLLMASFSLSLSVILLSVAFFFGHDTSVALGAVSVPLAGLGGWSYTKGLPHEKPAV